MSDSGFIMVKESLLNIGMSFAEACIICYTERVTMKMNRPVKIIEIALKGGVCTTIVSRTLAKAQRLGIISIERNEYKVITKCELQDLTDKVWSEPKQPKPKAERKRSNVSEASYVDYSEAPRTRIDNTGKRGIILEVFVADFADRFNGQIYRPSYNETTALAELTEKIMQDMTASNVCTDDETLRVQFRGWLNFAWSNADNWKRDRWSIDTLNRYYNELQHPKRGNVDPILESYAEEIRSWQEEDARNANQQNKPPSFNPEDYANGITEDEFDRLQKWYAAVRESEIKKQYR